MLVIFSPDFDLTNSLFMKRPMGCLYSRPLGALRLMKISEVMLCCNNLSAVMVGKEKEEEERKKKEEEEPISGSAIE